MRTLRPFLFAVLLIALAPIALAMPTGVDLAKEVDLWSKIVDQITWAVEAIADAAMPDPEDAPRAPTAESSEPPEEPTPEGYPWIEPVG